MKAFRFILGIVFTLMAIIELMIIIASFGGTNVVSGSIGVKIILFVVFSIGAVGLFMASSPEQRPSNQKRSAKEGWHTLYRILLRAGVFIVIWYLLWLIGDLLSPSNAEPYGSPQPSSGLKMLFSFFGVVLGGILAYYVPIPNKWKKATQQEPTTPNPSSPNLNNGSDVIIEPTEKTDKDEDVIVFDREDVDL